MSVTISLDVFMRLESNIKDALLAAINSPVAPKTAMAEPAIAMPVQTPFKNKPAKPSKKEAPLEAHVAPSSRKGKPTVAGDFIKKVLAEHPDELKVFKEANPELKGAHLKFVGNYKKAHANEYKVFEDSWKQNASTGTAVAEVIPVLETTPLEEVVTVVDTTPLQEVVVIAGTASTSEPSSDSGSTKRKPGAKKLTDMTPDELAAHNEKKAARKAKKAATAPLPASPPRSELEQQDVPESEFVQVSHGQLMCIRLQNTLTKNWASPDIWMANSDGSRGVYLGMLQEDNTIDGNAVEPILE